MGLARQFCRRATGHRQLKCSELGGLFHTMPLTTVCGTIGALAISAFPLTSGFVSKSMVSQAASDGHLPTVWLLLTVAQAAAGGMAALCATLQQRLGVTVIDGVSAAVKFAEALVSLGLKTEKRGDYAPPLPKRWVGWAAQLG